MLLILHSTASRLQRLHCSTHTRPSIAPSCEAGCRKPVLYCPTRACSLSSRPPNAALGSQTVHNIYIILCLWVRSGMAWASGWPMEVRCIADALGSQLILWWPGFRQLLVAAVARRTFLVLPGQHFSPSNHHVSRRILCTTVSGPLSTQPAQCLSRRVVFPMDLHIRMSVVFYWPVESSAGVVTQTNHGEDQRQDRWQTPSSGGDGSVVRAPDSWLKGRGFESLLERRENFLLQGRLSVLTLISVSVPPRVTAVARKRSRSFCQKCRWQVTAKHAYTLRMWLWLKWHGAWLYGVHRTCAETAAVSCGTSHASTVSTPLRWIFKKRAIKI